MSQRHVNRHSSTVLCQVTGKEVPLDHAVPADLIRESVATALRKDSKDWDPHGYVSLEEVNRARVRHIEELLEQESEDLNHLHTDVLRSLVKNEVVAKNINKQFDKKMTFGEKVADKIASFGGSWPFIFIFFSAIVMWMAINVLILQKGAFDPYPFILLNLVLSCLASVQAPVIMMSQNRQAAKDRFTAEHDYKVNLKAELEVRFLHEKLDKLINDQWKHLMEIQQMQMEMIEELVEQKTSAVE